MQLEKERKEISDFNGDSKGWKFDLGHKYSKFMKIEDANDVFDYKLRDDEFEYYAFNHN